MPNVIGVDLGGTKTALARYDSETWQPQEQAKADTHADKEFSHVYGDMLALIDGLKNDETTGIGIGVPGLVLQPEGKIIKLPNIPGAEGYDLQKQLANDTKLNVHVNNDANCFALAEALHGAGKGHSVCVGITMGTGVGGGIVIDGKLFCGAHGYAAEIGHMLLKPGEPPYETDDKRGDTEQFLSGSAFGKRCEAAGKPEDYLEGEVCEFMRPEVFKEVAWLCTNMAHLLDPDIIVFGGSAGHALAPHLDAIEKELKQWMLPGTPLPKLGIASVRHSATLGAALLVR